MIEKISCKRKNIIFETIDEFYIHLPGNIYNLTISNNINHSILLYMNETSEENYLYKYYIYPPTCQDISKKITVFHGEEFTLFIKETNTKYLIKFSKLPFDFGISKLQKRN